jgi:hypothetical protein
LTAEEKELEKKQEALKVLIEELGSDDEVLVE